MKDKKTAVIISGYFNPVHSGHASLFEEAKKLGDKLVVIVNNDEQVKAKGTFPFMNEKERKIIISAFRHVDLAYLSTDTGRSVSKTIEEVYNLLKEEYFSFIFANGGPRKRNDLPEYDTCKELGIKVVFDIGGHRKQSSSWLIQNTRKCDEHGEQPSCCSDEGIKA